MADIWAQIRQQAQDAIAPPPPGVFAPMAPDAAPVIPAQQPTVTLDQNPMHQQIGSDQNQLQKVRWNQANPWGTANNHPGTAGKIAHVLSVAGNIAGNIFAPATMALVPGTQMNMAMKEGGLAHRLNEETAQETENEARQAQTAHENASTEALQNPRDKFTTLSTDQGEMRFDPATGDVAPLQVGGSTLQAPGKQAAPVLHETDQGLMLVNPDTKEVTPLTLNGKPLMPKNTTNPKEQVQRSLLDAEQKGDKAAVAKYQQQLKDMDPMGQQRLSLTIRGQDIAGASRDQKADATTKQAAYKAFQPSLDSGERFNVMAKNYEDAIKNHDQQAMLSLLANHLGMTMGLQKGARLTKDIIREAQESRPWLQGLAAKFDKDGILSGVTLTPEQMQQMVDLGRGRFSEDTVKARSESRYLGSGDDGPDRVPNKATMNFYLGQTHGDVQKAKQLAADDGWTVK